MASAQAWAATSPSRIAPACAKFVSLMRPYSVQETGSAERGGQAQSRQNSHQPSHQPSRQSSHQHHESQRESDEKEENNANFGMQC